METIPAATRRRIMADHEEAHRRAIREVALARVIAFNRALSAQSAPGQPIPPDKEPADEPEK